MPPDQPPQGAEQEVVRLRELQRVVLSISGELNLKRCLEKILDATIAITGAERGFLMLYSNGDMGVEVARNLDREAISKPAFKVSRSVAMEAARTGRPIVTHNARIDERFQTSESVTALGLTSIICVPLRVRGESIGVIYLDHRFRGSVFAENDVGILEAFASQASICIENARLYQQQFERAKEVERLNKTLRQLNQRLNMQVDGHARRLDEAQELSASGSLARAPERAYAGMIGQSPVFRAVLRTLDRVVESDLSVLILGESGTGKELVARAIHDHGKRRSKPFIAENCAGFADSLLESELFGHVRGAFTGADRDRPGVLEAANGGTLFLDEVGDMGAKMQARLLRFLQDGIVRRVGGRDYRQVDVRILAATNRDLKALRERGEFREDLYYRLKVFTVTLPALRERPEDVSLLAEHFRRAAAGDRAVPSLARKTLDLLRAYTWPGNIRELQNEMNRLAALRLPTIEPDALSPEILDEARAKRPKPGKDVGGFEQELRRFEVELLTGALEATGWNVAEAARRLGLERMKLARRMEKYGLAPKT